MDREGDIELAGLLIERPHAAIVEGAVILRLVDLAELGVALLHQVLELPDGVLDAASQDPTFTVVDVDLKFEKPQLRVEIDRARARDLGISALDIARTLQLALSEQRLGFFVRDGKQFEVISQVEQKNRDETFDLVNLYVPSSAGTPVLLDKLVSVSEESSPPQLYRFDRYVAATVSAGLAPGKTIVDGETIYNFDAAGALWIGSALVSLLLATLVWNVRSPD